MHLSKLKLPTARIVKQCGRHAEGRRRVQRFAALVRLAAHEFPAFRKASPPRQRPLLAGDAKQRQAETTANYPTSSAQVQPLSHPPVSHRKDSRKNEEAVLRVRLVEDEHLLSATPGYTHSLHTPLQSN